MLDGWRESRGVQAEIDLALEMDLPIPCPHVSIPVYDLTRQVLEILADDRTYCIPDAPEDDARIAGEFFDRWSRLDCRQQESNLLNVLEKVVFDSATQTLTVSLTRAGMIALRPTNDKHMVKYGHYTI